MAVGTGKINMSGFYTISIVGAGAWGTALAQLMARSGKVVRLWAFETEVAEAINKKHKNPIYLPGVELSHTIHATTELEPAVDGADIVLLVVPAQHMRKLCQSLPPLFVPLVICSKGFEVANSKLMSEVVACECPQAPVAVLSGPSFAPEVAHGLPTAVTLACLEAELGKVLVTALGDRTFRPYWTDDLIGVQIGGAVKNVLAIAAGIAMGRQLGENARAALITRGLAELIRLGEAMGAQRKTLIGLSGLGDLLLTAASLTSRNTSVGYALGCGSTLEEIQANRRNIAEGIFSAPAVTALSRLHGVEMPICTAVESVFSSKSSIDGIISSILSRPLKSETQE
jgi:glycerol-3-phosphate dehydrogenase (NAD(P)+)